MSDVVSPDDANIPHKDKNTAKQVCGICLDDIEMDRCVLACNHPFCSICIIPWLQKGKRSCPTCRHAPKIFNYDSDSESLSSDDYSDTESSENESEDKNDYEHHTDNTCWRVSKEMRPSNKKLKRMHDTFERHQYAFLKIRHEHAIKKKKLRECEKKCKLEIDKYAQDKYAEFDETNATLIENERIQRKKRAIVTRNMNSSKKRIIEKTRGILKNEH